MKKLTAAFVSTIAVGVLIPGIASATDIATGEDSVIEVTTGEDSVGPTVPEECFIELFGGPARAAHSPAGEEVVVLGPCDEIEGICVEVVVPDNGPSRAAHRKAGTTEVPCVPLGPACDIVVDLDEQGPARVAHTAAVRPTGPGRDSIIVDIPQECQDLLSAALIPQSGSDSGTIMWLGALLVVAGGALLFTRRATVARTR